MSDRTQKHFPRRRGCRAQELRPGPPDPSHQQNQIHDVGLTEMFLLAALKIIIQSSNCLGWIFFLSNIV